MWRTNLAGLFAIFLGCSFLLAQDDDKLISGPQPGTFMPASFECFNVNGPAKGRPHCLVCKFALSPSVIIFTSEPEMDKDQAFNDLVKKLEETAAEFTDRNFSVGVVVVSPDARDSTNNAQQDKSEELIKEAVNREMLFKRLEKRAENLKHVVFAYYPPEGPKEYKLNPKSAMTVLFYERMKIKANWTFAPDALEDKHADAMIERIREALTLKK